MVVCSKLSVPMLIAIAYFVTMYFIGASTTTLIAVDAVTTYKTEMRKVCGI